MRIALDTFARSGIEARLGGDVAAGVQAALRHYIRRLGSEWESLEFPRFRREQPLSRSGAGIELAVEPEIEAALEQEAREAQGVSVEQLAAHAVMIYLADLDKEAERQMRQRPVTLL